MCNPFTSATCITQIAGGAVFHAAGQVAGGAANAAVGGLASSIQSGIASVATHMVAWWIRLPSPDVATDPVPRILQAWVLPFTAGVALISVITVAGRMILTRKSAPLVDAGSGLLTIVIVSTVGTLVPTLLLQAGDAYSNYVLNASTGGHFATRFVTLLTLGGTNNAGGAAILIVVGTFALIMAAIQAILLLFRQGAVIILAGMLPLAAAGQMTSLTRPWFKRTSGWMLALIFYKPAGATVYAVGFVFIGSGTIPRDVLMGFAILLLALVALPVLMRLFDWTTGQIESASGGGVMGAVIGGAAAVGAMRNYGGMSPTDQARMVSGALGGGPGGSGQGAGPGGGPGGGAGPRSGPGGGPAGGQPGGGQGRAASGAGTSPAGGHGPPAAAASGSPAAGSAEAGGTAPAAAAAGSGTAAGAATSAGGAAGAASGAAAAAAGPAGLIVLGGVQVAQAARGAATRLADGAAPPREQQ
jgi:hypothetical protein